MLLIGPWTSGVLITSECASTAESQAASRISFPCGSDGKEPDCNAGVPGLILGFGRTPWKMDFSFLAWEIPRTEESGGLQSMGLHGVGHDQATKHVCQNYWTRILILKNLGYYIYILNFEKSIKWNKTLWGTEKYSIFILFCFLINILKLFISPLESQAVFLTPGFPILSSSSDVLGSNPFTLLPSSQAEMSLLFSRVALRCEWSKGKKK